MGRPNQKDRGLATRMTLDGKRFWRVRLWHEGREISFQPFWRKKEAKAFYARMKTLQAAGTFEPTLYQRRGKEGHAA
jgi:hypothetical protein